MFTESSMKNKKIRKSKTKKNLRVKINFRSRKIQLLLAALVFAIFGGAYLLFAHAQTNNRQKQDNVDICDANEVLGPQDTILSVGPEAESLAKSSGCTIPLTPYSVTSSVSRCANTAVDQVKNIIGGAALSGVSAYNRAKNTILRYIL